MLTKTSYRAAAQGYDDPVPDIVFDRNVLTEAQAA